MPRTRCLTPLIDLPTGHYTNTGMHSSSFWLSFLVIIQQGRALERAFIAFNGRVRIAIPTRNIPEASKVGTPLYSGHFRWHQWCPHYRGSTVECSAYHCRMGIPRIILATHQIEICAVLPHVTINL